MPDTNTVWYRDARSAMWTPHGRCTQYSTVVCSPSNARTHRQNVFRKHCPLFFRSVKTPESRVQRSSGFPWRTTVVARSGLCFTAKPNSCRSGRRGANESTQRRSYRRVHTDRSWSNDFAARQRVETVRCLHVQLFLGYVYTVEVEKRRRTFSKR